MKEFDWFIGNFFIVKTLVKTKSKNGNYKRVLNGNNISINNESTKLKKNGFI
mgnify:CR=1 FL=1